MISKRGKHLLCAFFFLTALSQSHAREIHVSKSGRDLNSGSQTAPYLTISKAAREAVAGDTVLVHAGTYREQVTPMNSGTSTNRIVYKAVAGDEVTIKGSEVVAGWTNIGGNVWSATIPDSFFNGFNPYRKTIAYTNAGWLNYGEWHSPGAVYLNEEQYIEVRNGAVTGTPKSWEINVRANSVELLVNFGGADPNSGLVEINARPGIFLPQDRTEISYITVDGFKMMQCASGWISPEYMTQKGTIAPLGGKEWIIQNNLVSNSRCVGIVLGNVTWGLGPWKEYGGHLVRNNIIQYCGEAGIAGYEAPSLSMIEGNSISDISWLKEFGGYETAGIKFHQSTDVTIKGNIIRDVSRLAGTRAANYGIWIDYSNQGTRITGNVIYGVMSHAVMLEYNHGPILVDNNVFQRGVRSNSRNSVFAHNIFFRNVNYANHGDISNVDYNHPHSRTYAGSANTVAEDVSWYNNIFDGANMAPYPNKAGTLFDYNAFYNDTAMPGFAIGPNNLEDPSTNTNIVITEKVTVDGIDYLQIEITAPDNLLAMDDCPLITSAFIGELPIVKQELEDKDGNKITLNTDINGVVDNTRIPGPFANLSAGRNVYLIPLPTGPGAAPAEEVSLPQVSFTSHADGDQVSASEDLVVTFQASDNSGIKYIWLKLDDNSYMAFDPASPSYQWDLGLLSAGYHTLIVRAKATDDEVGFQKITIEVIDDGGNEIPVIVSDAWADPAAILLTETTTLSVVASDPEGDALTYRWSKVTGPGTVQFSARAAEITEVSFSAAGTYTLEVTVSDGAGSVSSAVDVTVTGNELPLEPTVSFTSLSDGQQVLSSDDVVVTVDARDNSGIDRVWLKVDSAWLKPADFTSPYEWNLGNLPIGFHSLTAKAHPKDDPVSFVITKIAIEVVADTGPTEPTASITSSRDAAGNVIVLVDAQDDSGIDRVWLKVDNTWLMPADTVAPYRWNLGNLSIGSHVVLAKAHPKDDTASFVIAELIINVID